MSQRTTLRIAARLTASANSSLSSRAIESPCCLLALQAAYKPQCAPQHTRFFTHSSALFKKAGKANKAHARSDSFPPDQDVTRTPTDEAYDVGGLEAQILKAIEHLTHELAQLKPGGKLNPELVENLKVALGTARDGKETVRLGDIAQVIPKGRLLNVMVGEEDHIKPVTTAIASSKHNLSPQAPTPDAPLTIPVPIPPPTGDTRQVALDSAQKIAELADKNIQIARQAHHKKLRKYQLDKSVLPDDQVKAGKLMEEVVKRGHTEVKRIVDGAKKVLQSI